MRVSIDRPVQISLPGSKSVTHRALVLAALCPDGAWVRRPLLSADTRCTLGVLRGLGARWRIDDAADVHFEAASLRAPGETLQCGNSGTTLRLLSGLCATLVGRSRLDGDASLRKRPNGPLLTALAALGAKAESLDGCAPLSVTGPASAGQVSMPAEVSSQYISSVALAAMRLNGVTTIEAQPPVASRPYLDITAQTAAAFGLQMSLVDDDGTRVEVRGPQLPACPAGGYEVAADWSSAAFPLVAATALSVPVALPGLSPDSVQGDRAIVDVLARFGLVCRWLTVGGPCLVLQPARPSSPEHVDVSQTPDMFPALCALAAVSEGSVRIDGAPGLRHKECDRIAAMAAGLQTLGVRCHELADGIEITGGPIGAGAVRTFEDHRIHMAFAILATVANGPVDVDHRGCTAVSYPDFHADLDKLLQRSGQT